MPDVNGVGPTGETLATSPTASWPTSGPSPLAKPPPKSLARTSRASRWPFPGSGERSSCSTSAPTSTAAAAKSSIPGMRAGREVQSPAVRRPGDQLRRPPRTLKELAREEGSHLALLVRWRRLRPPRADHDRLEYQDVSNLPRPRPPRSDPLQGPAPLRPAFDPAIEGLIKKRRLTRLVEPASATAPFYGRDEFLDFPDGGVRVSASA